MSTTSHGEHSNDDGEQTPAADNPTPMRAARPWAQQADPDRTDIYRPVVPPRNGAGTPPRVAEMHPVRSTATAPDVSAVPPAAAERRRPTSNRWRAPAAPAPEVGVDAEPVVAAPAEPGGGAAEELSRDMLFAPVTPRPRAGWRYWLYVLTFRLVNLGESPREVRRRELVARVCQPIRGDHRIGVLALKGGVGKTTVTVCLGATFASLRGDHVVAVDANPDRGTLSARVPAETTATVRHLLEDAARISRYSDVRAYTSQSASRLEVLASERDPHKAEAFSEADYRGAVGVLEHFYSLILTDTGTGLVHSAMRGVLDTADSLVLVSSPALDGAQSAAATLDWLQAQGFGHLLARTVVVISRTRPGAAAVHLDQLVAHFAARVRGVVVVPFDEHLAEGADVDMNRLRPATRAAFTELAAQLADDFATAGHRDGASGVRR